MSTRNQTPHEKAAVESFLANLFLEIAVAAKENPGSIIPDAPKVETPRKARKPICVDTHARILYGSAASKAYISEPERAHFIDDSDLDDVRRDFGLTGANHETICSKEMCSGNDHPR